MTTFAPTISARYFPNIAARVRDIFLVIAGSLLIAALAQIEIPLPFTPVPITGQTFGVLLIAAALGSKRGMAALLLYIVEGAAGLPFFAGGASGFSILTGATAGYLVGFVAAAYVVGMLAERGMERSIRTSIIPFLIGTLIIYICGVAWLAVLFGNVGKAIAAGLFPFLIGDAIKLIAASLILPAAWKLVK
jgi:biotin transport system substrate-specific component